MYFSVLSIKTLENTLGIQLFDRTTRNVVISEAGSQILAFAEQICLNHQKLQNTITKYLDRNKQALKIASIPVMAQYGITGTIARFQKSHPAASLSITALESYDIPRKLETSECELAFIRKPAKENSSYDIITYRSDHLVAVLPSDHPYAGESEIDLTLLKDEGFMFLDKGTMLYTLCFDFCVQNGFTPKVSYTGHRPENIIDLVSGGAGISLLMKGHADYFINSAVSCVEINPTLQTAICLAKMKNHKLSPIAQSFWTYLKNDTDVHNS